jgi:hypothetical protein
MSGLNSDYAGGLYATLLQRTLDEAAAASAAAAPRLPVSATQCARACCKSVPASLAAVALLALCILLIVRPPFVMLYDHDSDRPWRGTLRVSWTAVLVTVLLTTAAAAALPCALSASTRMRWLQVPGL